MIKQYKCSSPAHLIARLLGRDHEEDLQEPAKPLQLTHSRTRSLLLASKA